MIQRQQSTRILLLALALGWLANTLFYARPLGISFPFFIFLLITALFGLGRLQHIPFTRHNSWPLLPLLFFAAMVALRANPFLTALNVLATLALLAYLATFYAAGRVETLSLLPTLAIPLATLGRSLTAAGPLLAENVDLATLRGRGRQELLPVIRGGMLAAPVLLIFGLLLASADLIFADRLTTLFSFAQVDDLMRLGWQATFILAVAWLTAGGLVRALERPKESEEPGILETGLDHLRRLTPIGFVEATTILTLVNGLFLSFVAIQFRYLFGGEQNITQAGYTYAQYARRGFFELVAVAILSLVLILALNWLTWRASKKQFHRFNALGSLTILLVLTMLLSAFQRMRLYEAAFGYTRLRLYVYVFILWLGVLLLWFLWTLWLRPDRFAIGFIAVAIGFLATLNLINPDAFIARQNVARYLQDGDLDVLYLTTLSDDAVPQLTRALSLLKDDTEKVPVATCAGRSQGLEGCLAATRWEILIHNLEVRREYFSNTEDDWPSLHLARWRAKQELAIQLQ